MSAYEKYSGRPGTMPLDDLWDRLEALFAAQEAKSNSEAKEVYKSGIPEAAINPLGT